MVDAPRGHVVKGRVDAWEQLDTVLDAPRGHVVKGGVDAWEQSDAGVVLVGVGQLVSPPKVERCEAA